MTDALAANAAAKHRPRGKPFKPGVSGNPNGKRPGTRHRATRAVETLLQGEAEKLTRKAIELGLAGNMTALRLCLDRIAPLPRTPSVHLDIPKITRDPKSLAAGLTAVLAAVAEGAISVEAGEALVRIVERAHEAAKAVPVPRSPAQIEEDKKQAEYLSSLLGDPFSPRRAPGP